ncbi:hypothetical protein COOONC_17236 [Cooperia oncophora]
MHLYVRSMVSPVYQLLRIYEEEGYLSIQPWLRVTLLTIDDRDFNPNINIEFRNQAAAQTDCLLQYKETASYIAFMDLDDVLIPRMARNYLDEFAHLFHSMPNVAFLVFPMGLQFHIFCPFSARNSGSFSLRAMLSTIHFEHVSETGKMVADPLQVNHTWIHYPKKIARGKDRYTVPNHLNAITHLKHMHLVGGAYTYFKPGPPYSGTVYIKKSRISGYQPDQRNIKFSKPPAFKPNTPSQVTDEPLLSLQDIDEIQLDFERMSRKPEVAKIFPSLPRIFVYREVIDQCFEDTYYKYHYSGNIGQMKCPGPDRCLVSTANG